MTAICLILAKTARFPACHFSHSLLFRCCQTRANDARSDVLANVQIQTNRYHF